MSNAGATPKRGRPVTTDPAAVSLAALKLFAERGIEAVTMDEVAVVAGISRSNLFRLFPSKAAVVWGGVHKFAQQLEKELAESKSENLVSKLHNAWVDAMHELDGDLEVTRLRLSLIGSSPEVYGWGQGQLDQVRGIIETSVLKNGGDALRAKTVSAAIVSASMAIMIHWAQTGDKRAPSQILDEGFRDFEDLFARS